MALQTPDLTESHWMIRDAGNLVKVVLSKEGSRKMYHTALEILEGDRWVHLRGSGIGWSGGVGDEDRALRYVEQVVDGEWTGILRETDEGRRYLALLADRGIPTEEARKTAPSR